MNREPEPARRGEKWWFLGAAAALAVVFLTPLSARTFFHLSTLEIRTAWPWFLAAGLVIARWLRVAPDRRAPWLLVAAQAALVLAFWEFTRGELPTRDDHPSFLYRFHLLREMFPRPIFYNPEWNGGYVVYELVATGALSPFLLSLPFVWLAPLETFYAFAIPYFDVLLLPWLFFAALRLVGVSRAGAALGGILALAPTTFAFLYELLYGLHPFAISCTLAVVAAALFARLFCRRDGDWAAAVALVSATSLCVFWPLGALMIAPLVPAFFFAAPRLGRDGWAKAIFVAGALLALNLPWVLALATYGDSAKFVAEQRSRIVEAGMSWGAMGAALVRMLEELHPLTLVLLPAGMRAARDDRLALPWALLAALVGWNLVVAVLGPQVKEQIALERFSVPFALFAAVGASAALARLVSGPQALWRTAVLGIAVGVLLMSTVNAAGYLQNRGHYRYMVMPADLRRTIDVIRDRCPVDRRVLVPGFSLHWFGGGHIAALPLLAGRSFVGNDFYHRRDYNDAVPPAYRSPQRLGEFLELYDVGCVLTWNEPWAKTLAVTPGATLFHDEGWLRLFAAGGTTGNRFLVGRGRVSEEVGRIVVETADEEAVIKYRWAPGLRARPDVLLDPYPVYGDVSFIRLRTGGARRIEIGLE